MASTDKKKFKITETSKQASVDITSDKIQLSADSADHVLVAKVPSSANLSGSVNVEVEMSPDGQNWCNAVRREVVSTAPSSTGNVIGNEQMVKLIPSATEPKNKHDRGSLNFDDNGNTVATFNAGTRDFMHQHIHKSKSFNYSQWFKTSEAPTTTYKPVLFRHGGYDNFENTHVIETDGTSNTQNLVESLGTANKKYLDKTSTAVPDPGVYSQTTFTNNKGWFPTYDDSTRPGGAVHWWTQTDSAISFWHKGDKTQSGQVIMYQFYHDHGAPFNGTDTWEGQFYIFFSSNRLYIQRANRDYYRGGSWGGGGWKYFTVSNANSTDWHHYVINIPQNASLYTAILNSTLTIDGGNTAVGATSSYAGTYDPDPAALTVVNAGVLADIPSTSTTPAGWTGTSTYTAQLDELSTWGKSLTSQEISEIYNSGSYFDVTTSSCSSYLERHIRFGDESGDGSSLYDAVSGTSFLDSHNSTDVTSTLGTSESIYFAGAGKSADLFTTSSNLSISGWFKTTTDATGTLFSNTGGAAASGLKLDVNASDMTLSFLDTPDSITINSDVNDGLEWHHLVITKNDAGTNQFTVYVDGSQVVQASKSITDADLKGSNGFTLLSDGQNNAHASPAASTDASKLNAAISNWSLHSEVLDANAVKQLYSNGHARNIKNLPSVTVGTPGTAPAIEAWWQLSDATNPENDLIGTNHLQYEDGAGNTLVSQRELATGAVKVVDSINGNGMTLSLTKSFNFTTNEWVSTADQDAALCLSFNGFEEQAEYFALWKCAQTPASGALDLLDGNWHNVTLSYRSVSSNSQADGHLIRFGPNGTSNYNWNISMDGEEMYNINSGLGADAIGGLNALDASNQGFVIQNRHLRYDFANDEEEYKAHSQFSAGVNENNSADSPYSFQAYVDETSFHSESWWVAGSPNSFNAEKPATIYGNTGGANNRGTGTEYPKGVPYPLLNPEKLTSSGDIADIQGTNQYIDPNRYDASTNTDGGLEAWWRWGDTPDDCQITINDVKDAADGQNYRDLIAFELSTSDVINLTSADSIYNADATASSGGTSVQYNQIKLQDLSTLIGTATCAVKDFISPVFQYLRIKLTGSGTCDIGEGKLEIEVNHKKRRMK